MERHNERWFTVDFCLCFVVVRASVQKKWNKLSRVIARLEGMELSNHVVSVDIFKDSSDKFWSKQDVTREP